jgi:vacuolar protein-sorting-associated protein 4
MNEYFARAEYIKKQVIEPKNEAINNPEPPPSKGGAAGGASKKKTGKQEGDDEESKHEDALSQAIITEKPNVSWDDVSGLEGAKEAL